MSFTCMFGINYVKPQLLTVSDSDFPEYSLSESHRIVVYRFVYNSTLTHGLNTVKL